MLWIALGAGLAVFAGLVAHQGVGDVLAAVALAGWGVLLVTALHAASLLSDAVSWRVLLGAEERRRSLAGLTRIWWIGYSVNALLPVAQVGGELVRARLLSQSGVPGSLAGASVIVGLTAGVLVLLVFSATGALLLGAVLGGEGLTGSLALVVLVLGGLLAGFYLAQRGGLFVRLARRLERLAGGRDWLALTGGAAALDRAVAGIYRDRRALTACFLWRSVGWLAEVAEVWLVLHVLGQPVTVVEAFVLESLAQAVRSAGFAVPGALGVQEGGFLVLGTALGLPGEVALAVSLVKRVRDLLIGLPGLAAWQVIEGAGLLRRHAGRL